MKMTLFWDIAPCNLIEVGRIRTDDGGGAERTSETSVNFYEATGRNIPDECRAICSAVCVSARGWTFAVLQFPSWEVIVAQIGKKFLFL
jgi:hypothetical protein